MSKNFAIGEVLTAQDVNEFLANRIHRTILTGNEMVNLDVGSPTGGTYAIADTDDAGNAAVTFALSISNHGGQPAGAQNTVVGTLAPIIRPNTRVPLDVGALSQYGHGYVDVSGEIIIRYWSASIPNATFLRIAGAYPVVPG